MDKHQFGWIPDLPDQRDFLFSAVYAKPPALPASIDLRAACSPVEEQKKLGSWSANALVGPWNSWSARMACLSRI